MATVESVQQALSQVVDPLFERSLGELQSIQAVEADGDGFRVKLVLSSPDSSVQSSLEKGLRSAAEGEGVKNLSIDWDLRIPMRETAADDPLPEVRNIILVMSGKGGVGKSTVAANLALALKRGGARVGLLDADMYGPSIPTMLGIEGAPSSKDGNSFEPLERYGLKLMSVGFLLEDPRQAVVWRGPMLHGALQQFLRSVQWGPLDFLVLDMPPGTGDVALSIAQEVKVSGAVVVTTPQEVALQDVYKSISMCKKMELPVLGVVENMSYFVDPAGQRHELFGAGGGEKAAQFANSTLLGQIPIDPTVREQGDAGTPVVEGAPDSPIAKLFIELAGKLASKAALQHFKRGGGKKLPSTDQKKRLRVVS